MKFIYIALFVFVSHCWAGVPWKGEPRTDDWWKQRHQSLLKQTAEHKADLKVIFFGDSITEGWGGAGKPLWDKYYAPRHAYNYAIGGDRTEHLIWRMENGEFEGLNSTLVVLKIGTNNLYSNTEKDIAHGIREILDQLETRQPNAKILLLGIIPRDGKTDDLVKNINDIIATYKDDKKIFFLNMNSHYETAPGVEVPDLYVADKVHLTAKGYQVWYDTMEPLFSKLYGQ